MNSEKKMSRIKAFYIALAIFVAAGVWLFVDVTNDRTVERTITDIPIEYINESSLTDRGLMLVEEGSDTSLDLTLEGTRWLISNVDRSDIRVTVDLSNVDSAGTQTVSYLLSYTDRRFSNNAIIRTNASIYNATVNISELYSRTVEVRCELVGNVADGYSAGQVELSHTELDIEGQAEDIDSVAYAKVVFDIGDDAVETVTQDLTIRYYDEHGNELSSSGIHPEVDTVQATLPVFVTKELQLRMNFISAPGAREGNLSYEIRPGTITVSGDASVLKDVDSITLDTFRLEDLVNSGISSYSYPITVPEGCQNLSGVTRATLQISFKDLTFADVTTDRFRYENLPEGKSVEVLTEEINIRIYGTAANVAAIDGSDLTVVVDLSDYASALGTYTVPATVETSSGSDVGVSGTYEVRITIREPDDQDTAVPEETPAD